MARTAPHLIRIKGCTASHRVGQGEAQAWPVARNNRGNAYTGQGQYDRAIQDYDKSIAQSQLRQAFNNRGVAYQKNEWDRAIKDFDAAINLNPHYANARTAPKLT
jgi:tetratricopeptide (TPR) repeat protein